METDEELRNKARKIAKKKSDFYIHLVIYIAVNTFLIAQWWTITDGNGFAWFVFPLFGWGIGLAAHAVETFRGDDYVEKRAEKEYQKLKDKEK
jgi:hypothetical protein